MELKIKSVQYNHYLRLRSILEYHPVYVDVSGLGLGKTYMAGRIALDLNLPILVISPKSLIEPWKIFAHNYGIKLIDAINYSQLHGIRLRNSIKINHPYLIRNEDDSFTVTKYLANLIYSGVLIVFDEISFVKNINKQSEACCVISSFLAECFRYDPNLRSRIACLSKTPFDKPEHIGTFLRLTGIMTKSSLIDKNQYQCDTSGYEQFLEMCNYFDYEKTQSILPEHVTHNMVNWICYNLYLDVIKDRISSFIEEEAKNNHLEIINCYYQSSDSDMQNVSHSINTLRKSVAVFNNTGGINKNGYSLTPSLKNLELSKLGILCRVPLNQLNSDHSCKVIIYVNYKDSIHLLHEFYRNYGSVTLYGNMTEQERCKSVHLFQKDPNTRVLIANPIVGGIGLNLDDEIGNSPRYMYIVNNFDYSTFQQSVGRIDRINTKSKPTVYIVNTMISEDIISNVHNRKSEIIAQISDNKNLMENVKTMYEWPDGILRETNPSIKKIDNVNLSTYKSPPQFNIVTPTTKSKGFGLPERSY